MRHPNWNYFEMICLIQMVELGVSYSEIGENLKKIPQSCSLQYKRFKSTGNMLTVHYTGQDKNRPQDERLNIKQQIRQIKTVKDSDKYWLEKFNGFVAPQFREMYQERYGRLVK